MFLLLSAFGLAVIKAILCYPSPLAILRYPVIYLYDAGPNIGDRYRYCRSYEIAHTISFTIAR